MSRMIGTAAATMTEPQTTVAGSGSVAEARSGTAKTPVRGVAEGMEAGSISVEVEGIGSMVESL